MKLLLSKDNIIVQPATPQEKKKLREFPGLFRDRLATMFHMPADARLAYNLVCRLQRVFNNVEIDERVQAVLEAELRLKPLPDWFTFHTTPKNFQEIALRYCYTIQGGGLLLDPGMGKTKVVLDFIKLMKFRKSVIVCPKPLLFVWEDERQLHRPDLTMYVVQSTDWEKEKDGISKAQIVVINYSKAVMFMAELFECKFDFIGLDEALIKDVASQRTEKLTWLRTYIPYRMLMSGTLVNNSPLDVYSPIRFLSPVLVGTSYPNFKKEYAVEIVPNKNNPSMKLLVGYKNIPEVKSILETVSIVMTKDQWLNLPKKVFEDVYVQPSDHQREVYQQLQSNYIATVDGDEVEIANPLVALAKLIQISSGFLYIKEEDDIKELLDEPEKKRKPKRKTFYFEEQPKLGKLIELIKDRLHGKRIIVWYNMQAEYELISNRFINDEIKFIFIKGGEKDTGGKVRLFNSDPNYTVLLCQARSVNYGITVLGKDWDEEAIEKPPHVTAEVFTQIFYSLNFSLEVYLQQQDRIHRLGQEKECLYIHLLCNTAAERKIIEKLQDKLSIKGQVLEDVIHQLGLEK